MVQGKRLVKGDKVLSTSIGGPLHHRASSMTFTNVVVERPQEKRVVELVSLRSAGRPWTKKTTVCAIAHGHADPQVVFDRFDTRGSGSISADDARSALEYMGRDVTGEACAAWLADKGKQNGGDISFVDFTTA